MKKLVVALLIVLLSFSTILTCAADKKVGAFRVDNIQIDGCSFKYSWEIATRNNIPKGFLKAVEMEKYEVIHFFDVDELYLWMNSNDDQFEITVRSTSDNVPEKPYAQMTDAEFGAELDKYKEFLDKLEPYAYELEISTEPLGIHYKVIDDEKNSVYNYTFIQYLDGKLISVSLYNMTLVSSESSDYQKAYQDARTLVDVLGEAVENPEDHPVDVVDETIAPTAATVTETKAKVTSVNGGVFFGTEDKEGSTQEQEGVTSPEVVKGHLTVKIATTGVILFAIACVVILIVKRRKTK
jgi:hypothetical protein